ncbi:MAG: beta strand repeat-containing protein, partial [Nitrososphaerales archaeon]
MESIIYQKQYIGLRITMTFLSTDKMKLSVLVVSFLLLVSAFTFLPAVGAFSPTAVAKSGPAPATITGASASIDYPILAGYSVVVNRTISLANPIGNGAISTFTISIPKGAATTTPHGSIYAGTTGTVATFGTGPWAVVWTATGGAGGTLVPGGATVTLTVGFTTESTYASTSGVADPYTLSTSVTDTTGAPTTLASITVYETASTSVTVTGASGTLTAGTPFSVKASGTDSGLPLVVTASGSLSDTNGVSTTTTLSPSSFTTGPNTGSQTISTNDTTAETLTVTVSGGTPAASDLSTGLITGNTGGLTIHPAAVTALAIHITTTLGATTTTYSSSKIINITNAWGLRPIWGLNSTNDAGNITISTADKYGNPAPYGTSESITVTANTLAGQTTGFSQQSAYQTGGAYPYAPTNGVVPTVSVTIGALQTSVTLNSTTYFFFGVDYGSSSYLTASSSASGLSTGSSAKINTYTLNAAALTITPSTLTPTAGKTITLTATMANPQQANVPVNFANSTDTTGLFTNGLTSINSTMTISSGSASSVVTFTPSTKALATVSFTGKDALPGTNGVFAYNTATGSSGTITTQAGTATALAIATYFDSGITHPSSMTTAKGQLYVDANTTDAYGNPAPVSTATQVTL